MRKLTLLVLAGFCQLVNAGESEKKPYELNEWNPLQANYKIHSGGTAYSELPTKDDSALTVAFRDDAARQVFEQIGPDVKSACNDARGYRVREKKGVYCSYTPHLENPKNAHYRCWVSINLRTGEGDVRVSC
jgi:hypothetical protein